jgi:hypothetical protein
MKAKQIEKLLNGLMNNFIESIKDKDVKTIFKERSFITGGCIPSMIIGEFVNDFDIYLMHKEDANKVRKYYTDIKFDKKDLSKEKVYLPKLITENSVNLTDKVQVILKFVGTPEEVTKHFDWQHIKSYFTIKDGLKLTEDVYRLVIEKELIYTGSNYPLSSLLRLRKYLKKGWTVSTKTMIHIILDTVAAMEQNKRKNVMKVVDDFCDDLKSINDEEFEKEVFEKEVEGCVEEEFDYENNDYEVDVRTFITQLGGIDPLTIQKRLKEQCGKNLTVSQIIELIEE